MHVASRHLLGIAVLCAAALALAGCGRKKEAPQQPAGITSRAVQAAEDQLRADTKAAGVRFRGVMPWAQALPNRVAVCGQAAVFGANSDTFVPFVSVVSYAADGNPASLHVERAELGSTVDGAGRVYLAQLEVCWENGGPKPGPVQTAASLPPTPNSLPDPAAPPRVASPPPAAPPAATASSQAATAAANQTPASGDVTLRQNGNLRSSPQGAVVRVVQQGTALKVFAQAPGGWYQVGDTEPLGWIHSSLLDKH